MENYIIKRPSDCSILIIDDEEKIVEMLEGALKKQFKVFSCKTGKDAFTLIDSHDFDIVVTDLKLPDMTGLDVLSYAKGKDEYTEVIVVTGFASLDSATLALNLGVYSYLIKPITLSEFLIQVEKAVSSRLFHLRSLSLMRQSDFMSPDVKGHLNDITQLYYFLRKLMLSLEVPEIMRITLEDVNQKMGSVLAIIGVNLLGFSEIFAMPLIGEIDRDQLDSVIVNDFQEKFPLIRPDSYQKGDIPLMLFKGKQGILPSLADLHPVVFPLMVTDRTIGSLSLFFSAHEDFKPEQQQFLYVFNSIVSSIIEHGYSVLQARQQAKTDSLTGIANHRQFHETLEREIARANRKGSTFVLILIDIDNFKKINDTYGHQVGDAVLVDLTKRIGNIIRTGDVLARYGGEEFGLILPDSDLHGAEVLASRILKAFTQPLSYSQHRLSYTASLGMALYNGQIPVKKDALIKAADQALYDSKENGKNRFTVGKILL